MNGLSKSEKTFSSFVIHLFSFLDILLAFASLNINYSPLFPIHFKRNQKKEKKKYIQKKKIPNSAGAACLSHFHC
jgi:hypothetical protein